MPRKDEIHDAVRNALIKDGWTITDDPFRIVYEDANVYAALRIEKTEFGTQIRCALVIEIKGFTGESPVHSLENALGQYQLFQIYPAEIAPEDKLYLAISETIYEAQFTRPSFEIIVTNLNLALLVINIETEEVVRWIN